MGVRIFKTLAPFLTTFSLSVVLMSAFDSPGGSPSGSDSPPRITIKAGARYTDEARAKNVEGKVRLRVVLLASGQVGQITVIDGLPYGLTEQAIEAARTITFEPATKNGAPDSTVITLDYGFTIY